MDDRIAYSETSAMALLAHPPSTTTPSAPVLVPHPHPRRPRRGASTSSRLKKHKAKAMKWVRRIHLYSGLALVPFVLLYGLSGLFFNHPALGSDLSEELVTAEGLHDAGVFALRPAAALGTAVVAGLQATDEGDGFAADPRYPATYTGSFSLQQSGDEATWFLASGADLQEARIVSRPQRRATDRPLRIELRDVDAGAASVTASLESLLGVRSGATESRWRRVPSLEFGLLDADGVAHAGQFDLRSRRLEIEPRESAASATDFITLAKRMHKAHGYPDEAGTTRWFWAILADTMGVAMVIWGLSGLAMWWQMKNLRRVGAVAVVVGIAAAIALAKGFLGA